MRSAAAAVLVFLGGFIIMVLEIIGARFLAKDFGSSFHVWVSQIGVVLIALALGYYLGGALADRWQRLSVLVALPVPAGLVLFLIPTLNDWHADIVGAIYRTLQAVFPQVYLFPARSSQNVVLIATRAGYRTDIANLHQRAGVLLQIRRVTMPTFRERLQAFRLLPPPSAARSPVLTDDYAPVEGLAAAAGR